MARHWITSLPTMPEPNLNQKMEEVTVRYQEQEELLGGLVSMSGSLWMDTISAIFNFIDKTFVIAEVEIRKLRHDYFELITRSIQPILWLLILGQVFNRMHAIPT